MEPGDRWIELSEGDEFAGYRIERQLGRGGMGVLYLAVEPGLERRVALKLIAPEAAADEVFARRFAEESRIAASIEHPNVVPIYAAGEEAGVPFIAMRYVSGSDLGKRLGRAGRLPPAAAAGLIAQVGNGLDAIHAAGLVHRDVKPANVLLSGGSGGDHAYITDFGVARNVSTQSGLTQTGRFVGTLDYVAPEQISAGTVDARADVYALGCLLFKLLTGEVPFPRDGEAARLYAHLNDPPPAPSLYVTEVSMALDDVVIRAMSKEPDDRYPSAGDLGRAAMAALSGASPDLPERTVATGAAATRESAAPEPPTVATPTAEETAQTRRIDADPSDEGAGGSTSRRRLVLAGAAAAAAMVIAAAIAIGGGGGEDPNGPAAAGAGDSKQAKANEKSAEAEALTASQLRQKADEICADSQEAYKGVFSRASEESPDAAYSQALVGISTRAVGRFRALRPPPALEADYEDYVRTQERVKDYDRQALDAADAGDATAYLEARQRRDGEVGERYELARSLGFETCSPNRE
ncbi:MAG TPA: serine/threonine-protein kinase [Solirubrobacterales bacterium]|nr:serine/threonine-protein kinase [Solirubrobacterales bacterium]